MQTIFGKDNYFYHATIRRYTVIFGTIFSDLHIMRKAKTREEFIKIPLKYGIGNMYEKADQSVEGRENVKVRQILPAMSFEMGTFVKDDSRKTNRFQQIQHPTPDLADNARFQFNRQPYDFTYTLTARTKNQDDMLQIIEQIASVFNPSITINMQENTAVDAEDLLVISLESVETNDNAEDPEDSRYIETVFEFNLKGYLYCRTMTGIAIREISSLAKMDDDVAMEELLNTFKTAGDFQTAVAEHTQILEKTAFDALSVGNIEQKSGKVRQTTTKRKKKTS